MKLTINLAKYACLLFVTFTFWNCTDTTEIKKHNWKLVWSDEFNTMTSDSLPDPAKWTFDIGTGPNNDGWGNNEREYYTKRTTNVKLDSIDGVKCLKITARSETFGNNVYTSGRINTKGLFSQQFGRIEARIKQPYGPGLWPAFWMLGSNIDTNAWPRCGEIDIMEYKGQQPTLVHGTVHCPSLSNPAADIYITQQFGYETTRLDADYHIYAVEWSAGSIDFYLDDILYREITKDDIASKQASWVLDNPFYIILNLAVGGGYVGDPNTNTTFPQTMLVDYVRVYKDAE